MNDFVIVVQGPTSYLPVMKTIFKKYNVIYSTWTGEEHKYDYNDIAVFSKIPSYKGPANMNLQKISTLAGLEKGKELGYERALKLRSDLMPTNIEALMKMLDNQDLNFLCWHYHEVYPSCPGYLVDYLMSGRIDDLFILWNIDDMEKCLVPEINLTNQYINKLMSTVNISYFLDSLSPNNDLYWIKHELMLSSYKVNHIYDKYRKYDFGTSKDFLNKNYMEFLKNMVSK